MVNIVKLKELVEEYDQQNAKDAPDYEELRARLIELVQTHGAEAVAIATGLKINSVKQHCRNDSGSAMIAESRLVRAELLLPKAKDGE